MAPMTPEPHPPGRDADAGEVRWRQVRELFDGAADLAPGEREGFLIENVADEDLREEVRSLLAALEAEEEFLERPAVSDLLGDATDPGSSENLAGTKVGAYRLLRLVGSGGMGVVYEAERADRSYTQRVAVKLVRRGADSAEILQRFQRERQILARLDHPGISRLLDGGVTPDGQPYYVMEYVEGLPITQYCDRHETPLRERLSLFRAVCEAVHFAHRNLVVHRDLKPGNILITEDGRVKLLDFGIAKLLSAGPPSDQTLTQLGGRMLTPAYASPEQVQGELVTTASDVYSLGVVLYELLTGRKPYDVDTPSLAEAVQVVVAEEPTRPSAAVTDATRPQLGQGQRRRMRRTLEGELDNIALMALRKDPERRYQSVAQLSDDIHRYLSGLPVAAQRDTAAYRVKKFVQRHRAGAAATGVVLITLVGGLMATLTQARRADRARALAERRFEDVRGLANALLFEVHDAIVDLPGSTAARELLVTRGLEYLDRLAEDTRDDPSLRREVARAYLNLGLVQGVPTGASLGEASKAEVSFARALEIAGELVTASPGDDTARRTWALAHEKMGDVKAWRGAVGEGVGHARQALAQWSYFAESKPDDPRARLSAVISHVKLGDLLGNPNFPNLDDHDGAVAEYRYALAMLRAPLLAASEDPGVVRYRGLVHERLGAMERAAGAHRAALPYFDSALVIRRSQARGESTDALRDVAVTHHNICGIHLALDDHGAAARSCNEMMTLYLRLRTADPANAQSLRDLALGHEMLYRLAAARRSWRDAAARLGESLALREELLDRTPDDLVNRRDWARSLIRLCEARARGRLPTSEGADACERGRAALLDLRETGITTVEDEELIETAEALMP